MKLRIRSLNKESLYVYKNFVISTLKKLNIMYSLAYLPKKKKRITLLKSPHVYKTSREQFQFVTHKILINLKFLLTLKEVKFLIMNKPKTVKMSLTKF